MITLCIRYRVDPAKLEPFRRYAQDLVPVVDRCGGRFVAYYLPTKLAGPTDTAIGLIDFPDLATYERYRGELARDPDGIAAADAVAAAGSILGEDRSFIEGVGPGAGSREG